MSEDEREIVGPLSLPSVSPAYVSLAYAEPTINFSVPVKAGDQVRGVLTMSLTAGEFAALQLDGNGQRQALLVDVRADAQRNHGLLLYSGSPASQSRGRGIEINDEWQYLDASLLDRIASSGNLHETGALIQWRGPVTRDVDPIASKNAMIAYDPVFVRRSGEVGQQQMGWTVLIRQCE